MVFYEKRRGCYDLVFKVIEAVDRAYAAQGAVQQDGVVSQLTRRKREAYEQINNSDDEVFQNYLYDWYLSKGWSDRLLEISSSYVVDYLRRSCEADLAHADLLWRYYAHYSDFLSAAEVQFQLAKSSLKLSLEKRIEYLSRAKANASTRMTGFSESTVRNRQSRQELLRNISDYLDIANIQDDILQKIRNDPRLQGSRKEEVVAELDGPIQPIDDVSQVILSQYYTNPASSSTSTPTRRPTTTSASSFSTLPTTGTFLSYATPGPTSSSRSTAKPSKSSTRHRGSSLP